MPATVPANPFALQLLKLADLINICLVHSQNKSSIWRVVVDVFPGNAHRGDWNKDRYLGAIDVWVEVCFCKVDESRDQIMLE